MRGVLDLPCLFMVEEEPAVGGGPGTLKLFKGWPRLLLSMVEMPLAVLMLLPAPALPEELAWV